MPYAKLRTELLAAREQREQQRLNVSNKTARTLLQLGVNLPGADKSPDGGAGLFHWALQQLRLQLPDLDLLAQGEDLLGPWALLTTPLHAIETKQRAVAVETLQPAARLLDIDIYDQSGKTVGRRELELPPRHCLLCDQSAVDCIRLHNHTLDALKVRVDELLTPFRA